MVNHQRDNSKGNYNYNAYTYARPHWAPHFHSNFEMIYVLRGKILVTVNENSAVMSEGEYCLVLSNQIHSMESLEGALVWIAVFSEQFVPLFAKQIKDWEGQRSTFVCDEEIDRFLKAKLILSEGDLLIKKACFYAFCDQFIKKVPLEKRNLRNNELICRIIDYVATHFKETISLEILAKELGYEYHYLSRLLHRSYHIDFSNLVNQYRMDHAIQLLGETDLSITDIAMSSGFRSIRSFNYTFKKLTGSTPTVFMKNL